MPRLISFRNFHEVERRSVDVRDAFQTAYLPLFHRIGYNTKMDDTTCPLCTTTYRDPRLLPCTHSFCLACIESFTHCKEPGDRVQCVLCGSEFTIPDSGINGLPQNTLAAKLAQKKPKVSKNACVGKHKSTTDATTSSALSGHHNCPAITRSSPQCKAANFVWRSKSAELLLTKDSAVGDGCSLKRASIDCAIHRDKNIELYCHDCATAICVLCYIEDHSRHRCSDIAKIVSQFREQVSSDAAKISGGIDRCVEAHEILAVGRVEYSVRASEIRAEVQNKAAEIKRKVDSDVEVILYGLDAIEKDYISDIDVMSKIVDRQAAQMAIYEKAVTQLLSSRTTPAEIAADSNSLHEKANELLHFDAVVNATKCTMKSNDFKLLVHSTEQQANIIGELVHEKTFDGDLFQNFIVLYDLVYNDTCVIAYYFLLGENQNGTHIFEVLLPCLLMSHFGLGVTVWATVLK